LWLTLFWVMNLPLLQLHYSLVNPSQLNPQPSSTTELPSEFSSDWLTTDSVNYVSCLYNFRMNRIEITISNSSHCVLIRCCKNMFSNPLPSKRCPSTVDSVTWVTCLPNRCLAMEISAVLLWLHTSGIQASCRSTFTGIVGGLAISLLLWLSCHLMQGDTSSLWNCCWQEQANVPWEWLYKFMFCLLTSVNNSKCVQCVKNSADNR
jgi:hypothetical protein